MSDDYQIRKDIDRAKLFLNNLEEVLEVKYGLTAQDIKELFSMYYDKSEVYSRTELKNTLKSWVKSTRATGVVLYRQKVLRLCELRIDVTRDTLPTGETRLGAIPQSYVPNEYVISPVLGYNDVVVFTGSDKVVKACNYGDEKSNVNLRATLFWRY